MSNRIVLASFLALMSMTIEAAPVTYTQEVPMLNGPVTVEVTVENGDFKMVRLLPTIEEKVLTAGVNAENLAEFDALTAEQINMDALKGVLTRTLEKAAKEEAAQTFVPGKYRSVIVSAKGKVAIEVLITENGSGDVKVIER